MRHERFLLTYAYVIVASQQRVLCVTLLDVLDFELLRFLRFSTKFIER